MQLKVIKYDLFTIDDPAYYFAHCISSDFALGAGIAVAFDKKYNMRLKLETVYPEVKANQIVGNALIVDNVFNLVTKKRYFDKPTYTTLTLALLEIRNWVIAYNIKKLGMPKIGCCRDKLEWPKVEELIRQTFKDTDVKITVCYL